MNILVCHKEDYVIEKIEFVCNLLNYNLFIADSYDKGMECFKKHSIDFLILDFSYEEFDNLLKDILEINKDIKTLILSDIFEHSERNGCSFCIENYNRKRLLNEFSLTDLSNVFKCFNTAKCDYFENFGENKDILKSLLIKFKYVKYDEDTKILNLNSYDNFMVNKLIEITEFLTQHDIEYEVLDNNLIKII